MKIKDIIVESQVNEIDFKSLGQKAAGVAGKVARGAASAGKTVAKKAVPVGQAVGKAIDKGVMAAAKGTGKYAAGWGQAGNRLAKEFVGKDPNAPWSDKNALPAGLPGYASYGDDLKPDTSGEVYRVTVRGIDYFKSYRGQWFEKPSYHPNDFSATHPIDDYKDYEVLDKILLQGDYDIVTVTQDPMVSNKFTATGIKQPK